MKGAGGLGQQLAQSGGQVLSLYKVRGGPWVSLRSTFCTQPPGCRIKSRPCTLQWAVVV